MAQELISKQRVAIVGAGPAGCICAYFLQDDYDVTLFDKGKFLRTILPTGGSRCNLAHAEFDIKSLAKNYPRGEKFLYSIFSRFSTLDTTQFFKNIGVDTYVQDDNRIFPVSNSSKDVQEKLLKSLKKVSFIPENVIGIQKLDNCLKITTNKSKYAFDKVVVAIGGHSNFSMISGLGINIIEPTQALVGLVTKENFTDIAGVSLSDVEIKIGKTIHNGDILFTHKGVSGPLIYKISSIHARKEFPYELSLKLTNDFDLQNYLNSNPHKEIKNLLSQFIPKSLVLWILSQINIAPDTACHKINGKVRDLIMANILNFKITITGKVADGEVVTCGGVDLGEINAKTLESKHIQNLYFCGEVLDIDGFCGGFNLQNCWSTGFIVSESIKNS